MYKVIHLFTDLQDNIHEYKVGDVYPREGLEVTKERIEELASSHNLQGKPLIEMVAEKGVTAKKDTKKVEEVVEETAQPTKHYTKSQITLMKLANLKALAKEQGIENADTLSGAEIKKQLISKLGL